MDRQVVRDQVATVVRETLGDNGSGDLATVSSLTATRLWLALETEFEVELPLTAISSQATVEELTDLVLTAAAQRPAPAPAVSRGEAAPPARPHLLLPLQEAYLLGADPDFTSDPVGCRQYVEVRIVDADIEALQNAWEQLTLRHHALNILIDPFGALEPAPAVGKLTLVTGNSDQVARIRRDIREDLTGPMPPGPRRAVTGFVSVDTEVQEAVLHLSADMILLDGYSLDLLLEELGGLYARLPLPAAPEGDLQDALSVLTAPTPGEASKDATAASLRLVQDVAERLSAPPSPAGQRRSPLEDRLDQVTWSAVQQWAHRHGVSPSNVVLAAFCNSQIRLLGGSVLAAVTLSRRPWLPGPAQQMMGPFTAAATVVADDRLPLVELTRSVHDQVWDAISHIDNSSSALARELSRTPHLGEVSVGLAFTSLLDALPTNSDTGFVRAIEWQVVETSGVALDCQVWEENQQLRIRWDIADPDSWPIPPEMGIADFTNLLRGLVDREDLPAEPTALQESYLVARAADETPDGCQIVFSFTIPDLEPTALTDAVNRWFARHEPLLLGYTSDGRLTRATQPPHGWQVPLIRSWSEPTDTEPGYLHRHVRAHQLTTGFESGAWPLVRAVASQDDTRTELHVTLDIAVIDAPWAHYLARDLARLVAGVEDPTPAPPPAGVLEQHGSRPSEASRAHWQAQVEAWAAVAYTDASPGAAIPSRERVRLEGAPLDRDAMMKAAQRANCSLDALLLSAFTTACAEEHAGPVPVTVVRWGLDPGPSGLTRLSWVTPTGQPVAEQATAFQAILDADCAADDAQGLQLLRRVALQTPAPQRTPLSVVYTCTIDTTAWAVPDGVSLRTWASATPGVHLDAVSLLHEDQLTIGWDADPEAFEPGWLQSAFARYNHLLAALAAGQRLPGHPRGELSAKEYRNTIHAFNATERPFHADRPIHRPVETVAGRYPDAIAIDTCDDSITFADLDQYATSIAARLRQNGLSVGERVLIACPRNVAMVAAVLGVLKAGGTYVPVELTLPADRVASVLEQTQATALLTAQPDHPWPSLALAHTDVTVDRHTVSAVLPQPPHDPDRLAYIIFTSGSTGTPKGVAVTHRAAANLMDWCWRTYNFTADDTGLAVASLGFDLSVFDLFGLLGVGARLYVASTEEQKDPETLHQVLTRRGITFWNSAPTALAQLQPLLDNPANPPITDLRLVFLSGDYTPLDLPPALRRGCPNAHLVSLGGATEATVWSNYFDVDQIDPSWRSIPYGRPIDNSRYYVLDERLAPCPAGAEGDLYIAGACLAQGYYGAPDLTAAAFLDDPHSIHPGSLMYRTGDRACLGPDGQLIFLGRSDFQVKVRGYRVELGEIEHHIRSCPGVGGVVVQVRKDDGGDSKIVAYLTPEGDSPVPTLTQVRQVCAAALPTYMLPNHVITLQRFPSTANGKLDRDALPWPPPGPEQNAATTPERVAPVLETLAGAFERVLGYPVEPDLDIWDQGATSFTLVKVSQQIAATLGVPIRLADVLKTPTLTAIAHSLAAGVTTHAAAAAPAEAIAQPPSGPSTPQLAADTPTGEAPAEVDFFSASDRERFKAQHLNRRPAAASSVPLPTPAPDNAGHPRRSVREFDTGPVPVQALSDLLALLAPTPQQDTIQYRYPSAGNTYGVQVYVLIKEGRVEKIPAGCYYYRPETHHLEQVGATLEREAHFYYNRDLFDSAAFEIYLIGALQSIQPLYGDNAARYLAIEAGCMMQLLQQEQTALGLGTCQIGEISPEALTNALDLGPAHLFLGSLLGGPVPVPAEAPTTPDRRSPGRILQPTAIIGMSARIPGDETFLDLGGSALTPDPRWGTGQLAGWLNRTDHADLDLLGYTPIEAARTDPQLLLAVESVWGALEDAGYTSEQLTHSAGRVGVFVATMWHDFEHRSCSPDQPGTTGSLGSDISQKISHHFGFTGPSLTIDSGCSSTTAAIHLARTALGAGECAAAIVVGVNLILHPHHLDLLREWGLTAQPGPSAGPVAFSADAAGWVPGEAVGALILRPAEAAITNGDRALALIEASHHGHAGGGGRFEAPCVEAMVDSIETLIDRSGHSREDVGYIECAAAGAAMFDTAEIEAISRVFDGCDTVMPIGTTKSALGHAEAASGIAQLVKTIAQFQQQRLLPTPKPHELNPMVPWDHLPIRLVHQSEPNDPAKPLTLIHGFSAGGAFAHLALSAPPPGAGRGRHIRSSNPRAVVWSAGSREKLLESLANFRQWLASNPAATVDDVAYTTQRSRSSQPWRWGCVATDAADVHRRLTDPAVADQVVRSARRRPTPAGDLPDERARLDAWLHGALERWEPEASPGRLLPLPATRLNPVPIPDAAVTIRPAPPVPALPQIASTEAAFRRAFESATGRPVRDGELHQPLEEGGWSSFTLERLATEMAGHGLPVAPAQFFQHRSFASLLEDLTSRSALPVADTGSGQEHRAASAGEDIAIIGIASQFPGAPDLDSFWQLLRDGGDTVGPLPADRHHEHWPSRPVAAGFLIQPDHFDAGFFQITPRDADLMDPQERLFLETSWRALEDAGYPPARLAQQHQRCVGVFAATMYSDYSFVGVEQLTRGTPISTGSSTAGIANRVSYAFNLTGPSLTVDTMCSASLTAVHLAVRSLRDGECQVALVGGVNLITHPMRLIEQQQLGMTSPAGRCAPFSADADGFVPGEGAGVLILKPLAKAVTDGDRVHAVIKGSAVGHTGRTNGYQVPDPDAEAAVMTAALADARIPASHVGYVEAHGTGTRLGDPVEAQALTAVLGADASTAVGSVKSNIGHLEGAAGIAGIIKVVLQMRHRWIAPSLHADHLNPLIDWEKTGITVTRSGIPWQPTPTAARLIGCVSSFGAGGSTAHVVLAEPELTLAEPLPLPEPQTPHAIIVSARSDAALHWQVEQLLAWLEKHTTTATETPAVSTESSEMLATLATQVAADESLPADLLDQLGRLRKLLASAQYATAEQALLRDLAYTLQVGREPFSRRVAVIASSIAELCQHLRDFLAGGSPPLEGDDPLSQLCHRWLAGEDIQWAQQWRPAAATLLALPGHPFDRRRHWYDPEVTYPGTRPAGHTQQDAGMRLAPTPQPDPGTPGSLTLAQVSWGAVAEPATLPSAACARILAVADTSLDAETVSALGTRGHRVAFLESAPIDDDAVGPWLTAAVDGCDAIVDLCDLASPQGPRWRGLRWHLLQDVLGARTPTRWIHVCSTETAHPNLAGGGDQAGLVIALGAEVPTLTTTVLTTDEVGMSLVQRIEQQVADSATEVLYLNGVRHQPQLTSTSPKAPTRDALDPTRPYLITGGTGTLGLICARHLIKRGARRLVLCGFRVQRPFTTADRAHHLELERQISDLRALGAEIETYAGPLSSSRFSRLCQQMRRSWGPWGGVIHCAGRMAPVGQFARADLEELLKTISAKSDLWEFGPDLVATSPAPAFVILFSSVAATIPALGAGVAGYAAANRYLDDLARRQCLPGTVSIAWPEWDTSGMTGGDTSVVGLAPLGTDDALSVLDLAIEGRLGSHTLVITGTARQHLDKLLSGSTQLTVQMAPTLPPVPAQVQAPVEPSAATATTLPGWLSEAFTTVLGLEPKMLQADMTFHDLGVGSVALAELTLELEARTGTVVSPPDLIAAATIQGVADLLADAGRTSQPHGTPAIAGAQAAHPAAQTPVAPTSTPRTEEPSPDHGNDKLAIVGMSCNLPGADTPEHLWHNLVHGHDAITEVPQSRWNQHAFYDTTGDRGTTVSKWGGFVHGVQEIDPDAFGLTGEQAETLDPCMRLVLAGIDSCLADAGYTREEVQGTETGVFVGARLGDYRQRVIRRDGSGGAGGDQNFLSAMASHVFHLTGPSMVVDTACSSGLTALALARQALLDQSVTAAFVAGSEYLLDQAPYLEFTAMGALSRKGTCRTFNADADGFVPAEGCAVILVKRLRDALRDGDRIRAVIDAVAIGNDGHTMGLTTPSTTGQEKVVANALQTSGYRAGDIGMIEAHGTATLIGDPIELKALTNVYGGQVAAGSCAIGSIKSNVGHLLGAAGMAGLVKAVLAVENGVIPPTLHCHDPNPRFDFASSPFYPVTRPTPWPDRFTTRVAGVSSFGLGGTNAHVVLSASDPSWEPPARAARPAPTYRPQRLWIDAPAPKADTELASLLQEQPLSASLLKFEFDDNLESQPQPGADMLAPLVTAILEIAPHVTATDVNPNQTLSDLGLPSIDRAEVLVLAMEDLGLSLPMSQFSKNMTLGDISLMLQRSA